MTALHQRLFEEKADAIYYVIDSGQVCINNTIIYLILSILLGTVMQRS